MECVWTSGICLEVVMNVYRRFMEGICMVSGRCSRRCLEVVLMCGIWKVFCQRLIFLPNFCGFKSFKGPNSWAKNIFELEYYGT